MCEPQRLVCHTDFIRAYVHPDHVDVFDSKDLSRVSSK
jgi:hypothetical protein